MPAIQQRSILYSIAYENGASDSVIPGYTIIAAARGLCYSPICALAISSGLSPVAYSIAWEAPCEAGAVIVELTAFSARLLLSRAGADAEIGLDPIIDKAHLPFLAPRPKDMDRIFVSIWWLVRFANESESRLNIEIAYSKYCRPWHLQSAGLHFKLSSNRARASRCRLLIIATRKKRTRTNTL